jgi:hypothetical protein
MERNQKLNLKIQGKQYEEVGGATSGEGDRAGAGEGRKR